MPTVMPWKVLGAFRDPTIPKLDNLRLAARAGLAVPATAWAWAAELEAKPPDRLPDAIPGFPCIIRSGSPTEDTCVTSNAGQLVSVVVHKPEAFAEALAHVVAALPRCEGTPQGAIFVQPFVPAEVAGITFFDGFYFEEATAVGSNLALTSGLERGAVRRGHVQRGDRHHAWLIRLHRIFGGRLDIEWARPCIEDGSDLVLLQVRPALFPVRRCETLSLANHKEILGDPPSPWMVGIIHEIGRKVMRFYEEVDPAIAAWEEPYSVELGERSWLNFSAFFRLMDRWGLPRTMVTEGIGGEATGPLDGRIIPGRFLRSLPTLFRAGVASFATLARMRRGLHELDTDIDRARTLLDLQRVNARAFEFSVRTNFALLNILSVAGKLRKQFGLGQAANVVTQGMMDEYAGLAARPKLSERLRGLEEWLRKYGHRGPLETDPRRPRFAELRDVLQADLTRGPAPARQPRAQPSALLATLSRPLFVFDEWREEYRDRLMRRWQRIRTRILAEARKATEAGDLNTPDDAFFLRSEDLEADPSTWWARAARRRELWNRAKGLDLPATAPRDAIAAAIARAGHTDRGDSPDRFVGIGLGQSRVLGTAVRAAELTNLLNGAALPESPVLVVDTLEPSWAVVFSRFSAVVAELGGELSHASILLREAGIPAVVNARGAYQAIASGDLIRVDPTWGEVRVEARHNGLEDGVCDAGSSLARP
ncbi:MAG TPA: PEP-utilizing enzyme [Isosphaeraceae bacterium]|nr:PEP-utilizing enzyme [Isosphaeraceae bacterium]